MQTTWQLFIALLVVLLGLRAYLKARRAGTWSWTKFGLTLLGILAIMALRGGRPQTFRARLAPMPQQ